MVFRASDTHCVFCQDALDAHSKFLRRDWCKRGDCARKGVARDETNRRERLERQAAELYPDAESPVVGVVPVNRKPLGPLPTRRREMFLSHLDSVIAESFAECEHPNEACGEIASDSKAPPAALVSTACGTCQGYCCQLGQEKAFLEASSIDRYRQRHPEADASSVREAYVARLPDLSVVESCIFHGEQGCTLDREMRADLCNTFHCSGLMNLHAQVQHEETRDAAVFACDGDELVRHTLVIP